MIKNAKDEAAYNAYYQEGVKLALQQTGLLKLARPGVSRTLNPNFSPSTRAALAKAESTIQATEADIRNRREVNNILSRYRTPRKPSASPRMAPPTQNNQPR